MGSDDTAKETRPLLSPRKSAAAALEVVTHSAHSNGGGGAQTGGVRPFREVFPSWLALCRLWFQGEERTDVLHMPRWLVLDNHPQQLASHISCWDAAGAAMALFLEVAADLPQPCRTQLQQCYHAGEDCWRARGFAALNMALALVTTGLLLQISYAQRNLQTALSGKDVGEMYSLTHALVARDYDGDFADVRGMASARH